MRVPDGSRTVVGPSIGAEEPRQRGTGMEADRHDCTWCGSAASIEHGICQVCLMEYPVDTKVIRLPLDRDKLERDQRAPQRMSIDLTGSEVAVE
jgi:hypothetical protein